MRAEEAESEALDYSQQYDALSSWNIDYQLCPLIFSHLLIFQNNYYIVLFDYKNK